MSVGPWREEEKPWERRAGAGLEAPILSPFLSFFVYFLPSLFLSFCRDCFYVHSFLSCLLSCVFVPMCLSSVNHFFMLYLLDVLLA